MCTRSVVALFTTSASWCQQLSKLTHKDMETLCPCQKGNHRQPHHPIRHLFLVGPLPGGVVAALDLAVLQSIWQSPHIRKQAVLMTVTMSNWDVAHAHEPKMLVSTETQTRPSWPTETIRRMAR